MVATTVERRCEVTPISKDEQINLLTKERDFYADMLRDTLALMDMAKRCMWPRRNFAWKPPTEELLVKAIEMIDDGKPTGQVIRDIENGQVFWSPHQWVSPRDSLKSNPEDWVWIGTEGWYGDEYRKRVFTWLKDVSPGSFPVHPGEWFDFFDTDRLSGVS